VVEINIKKAAANLDKKINARLKTRLQLWRKAKADSDKIRRLIISKYKPARLYQWRSVLNKNLFAEYSDIDFAVEGDFPPEKYFAMFEEADNLTSFPLDLIDMKKVNPVHAQSIIRNGKLVYEQK